MKIQQHAYVAIDYTLTLDSGEVVDRSDPGEPLGFVTGFGQIIPGLEKALEGMSVGDRLSIAIPPEDGYGVRDDDQVRAAPRSAFQGVDIIEPGMQFHAQTEYGAQLVTVVALEGDEVILDGNHPLAGQTLNFDVEVADIRDATPEELDHGHVHGAGCHHH